MNNHRKWHKPKIDLPINSKFKYQFNQSRYDNISFCGMLGKLFIEACYNEVSTKNIEIATYSNLTIKKVQAMQNGDIVCFSYEDIENACTSLYWVLIYSFNQDNYQASIKTPNKDFYIKGLWSRSTAS